MLTREEVLSGFKKVNFPEKLFDKSVLDVKKFLFFEESTQPNSQKEKDKKKLSQCYVLPWRLVQKNFSDSANNKNNTFIRGGNFVPKEPLINLKIDNFNLLYDKYSFPLETGLIYFKNNYGATNGPYNFDQINNLYKNKKLDSTYEFRPIDIFCFKDSELFSFQSVKIVNDEKWIDLIIDSPLLKYNDLFKNKKEEIKEEIKNVEKEEKIVEEDKKDESKNVEDKKEENKIVEEKKEDKKIETKKEEKIIEKKEDKKDSQVKKESEGKWEVVGKKKKSNKEKEDDSNQIIGLKTKDSKEGGKKGKKKKKAQFEDTNFELGFQIK